MPSKEIVLPDGFRLSSSFRKGTRPKVTTVAQLMDELKLLPPDMQILGNTDFGVRATVTNYNNRCLAVVLDGD